MTTSILKVDAIQHTAQSTPNIMLDANGSVTFANTLVANSYSIISATANAAISIGSTDNTNWILENDLSAGNLVVTRRTAGVRKEALRIDTNGAVTFANNVTFAGTSTFNNLSTTGTTTIGDGSGDGLTINAGTTTFTQGTANGLLYLNGDKVATSGSALTFDGNLGTTGNIYLKTAGTKLGWDVSGVYFNWIESGGTAGADYLRFAIANAEQMRLTSKGLLVGYTSDAGLSGTGNAIFSGYVGIGTSSPNDTLGIGGTGGIRFEGWNNDRTIISHQLGTAYFQRLQVDAASRTLRIDSSSNDGGTSGSIALRTTAIGGTPSTRLFINGAGNVGIGTSSPSISAGYTYLSVENATNSGAIDLKRGGTTLSDWYVSGGFTATIRGVGVPLNLVATGANYISATTNGSERLRIDSSGNLGLGVTPSAWGASKKVLEGTFGQAWFYDTLALSTGLVCNAYNNGSNWIYKTNNPAYIYETGNIGHAWFTATAGTAGNPITFTQAMTLDASGNLLVGTTSNAYSSKIVSNDGITDYGAQYNTARAGANYEFVNRVSGYGFSFYVNAAGVVATLSSAGVWTDASDARYKENIKNSEYGLQEVLQLTPRTYNIIGNDKKQVGFIAQEVIGLVPELVDSINNSVTQEDRYTLSYGQMSAVLVKAIQEQQAIIESLKARLDAANL